MGILVHRTPVPPRRPLPRTLNAIDIRGGSRFQDGRMRIGAAQARPAWLNPTAGTKTVVQWSSRAADAGVELPAFPEAFLSG